MRVGSYWAVLVLAALAGCGPSGDLGESGDATGNTTSALKEERALGVEISDSVIAATGFRLEGAGMDGIAAADCPTCSLSVTPNWGLRRILLLSIDGMHAVDLYKWVTNNPRSNIARLYQHGVDFPNATTPTPSGAFPGMLALVTGGTPKSTGVYHEDSYDRTLYPPGSNCTGAQGTEVIYDGSVGKYPLQSQLFNQIEPAYLPLTINTQGNCVPVYPHEFQKASTIFGAVRASGRGTSWADNHASYEILAGPYGRGLSELFAPEVQSFVQYGGTVNGVNLTGILASCNSSNSVGAAASMKYTMCLPAAQAYDDAKVQSLINKIDGFSADGSKKSAVPTLFGMNFEAVEVAQKLPMVGYLDAIANPSTLLRKTFQHIDQSIGRVLTELNTKRLVETTLVVLTARHGQAPIDPTLWRTEVAAAGGLATVTNPLAIVQSVDNTVDTPAAFVNPNSGRNPGTSGHVQTAGDVGIVWLQDQNNVNVSSVVAALTDPMNGVAMGATERPDGSIFSSSIASGAELTETFGDPQSSSDPLAAARAPNVFVQPDQGVIYTTSADEIADHGGGSIDDINVPLIVSNTGVVQHVSIYEPVSTTQVAPTILRALRMDVTKLTAVTNEGTTELPGITWGPGHYQAGSTINAVDYDSQTNTKTDGTPPFVSYFDAGSSICFDNVYLTDVAAISATIASNTSGGVFSIRIDSASGTEIGRHTVQSTGGWTTWQSVTIPITATTGLHTLCFRGENGTGIANLKSFRLVGVCVPECTGATCGSDGCGGTCGTCAFNFVCDDLAQCVTPPTKYSLVDPTLTSTIPAPAYDVPSGVELGTGGTSVVSFDAGDYFCYYGVDLTTVASLVTSLASATWGGVLSVRIDSPTGTEIGRYTVPSTGGATTWQSKRIPITVPIAGSHAVCIRGESGSGIANFQSFQLSSSPVVAAWTVGSTIPANPPDIQQGTTNNSAGYVSNFDASDYVCYENVDLAGVNSIVANVASSNAGGVFSARLGSPTGTRIATFTVPNTGGSTTWQNITAGSSASSGLTILCFVGESGNGIANLNTFNLSSAVPPSKYSVGSTISAVPPDLQAGTSTDPSNFIINYDATDYVCYNSVDLTGVNSIVARVASNNGGGTVSVRIGSATGTQIGAFTAPNTGGWTNWTDVPIVISPTSGVTTLCFYGSSGTGIANLQNFSLSSTTITIKHSLGNTFPSGPPDSQSGITVNGGTVTYFDGGDWFCYDGVDLTGVHTIVANAASTSTNGQFSVRIGSQTGFQIGSYTAWNTGGYSNWQNYDIGISNTPGVQKLCFYGVSGTGIANFNTIYLSP